MKNNSPKHVELVRKEEENSDAVKPLLVGFGDVLDEIIFVGNALKIDHKIRFILIMQQKPFSCDSFQDILLDIDTATFLCSQSIINFQNQSNLMTLF